MAITDTATAPADQTPADIAPATEFSPSGAPRQTTDIDMEHPAVDTNPREGTTVDQNRIDFNDPTVPGSVQVARNLGLKDNYDADKADKKS